MWVQVTVLEARGRIGGRMHTYDLPDGQNGTTSVDLGATFICGTSEVGCIHHMRYINLLRI